jgi:hypothetical protein
VPSSGEALTRKDTPFGRWLALQNRRHLESHVRQPVANKDRCPELEFVNSTGVFLMPDEGAREAQVFFRFQKVWLDAEGLFVMSNG